MQLEELSVNTGDNIIIRSSTLAVKRVMDLLISIPAIIVLLPVFAVIALAIKLDSPGPVIFCQRRVGLNGRDFTIYKFRTMVENAEKLQKLEVDPKHLDNFVFQSRNDPRVTKLGAFLRKTSLDELPQLFNVLIGNMSLIGPRPEIHEIADLYNSRQRQRLLVKPGITGLAQVMGRGELPLGETIEYDLEYIRNLSIVQDINILIKTLQVVLTRKGAF